MKENLKVTSLVSHYMGNAGILREAVIRNDLTVYGGVNAPISGCEVLKSPQAGRCAIEFLNEANIAITPGSGFGGAGEGFFRISAFDSRANGEETARRSPR